MLPSPFTLSENLDIPFEVDNELPFAVFKEDKILEIGPGQGALTFSIKSKKVFAIEIDKDLCNLLSCQQRVSPLFFWL